MKNYVVLFNPPSGSYAVPSAFCCQTNCPSTAEEFCLSANPDCDIVWIYEGTGGVKSALDEFWAAVTSTRGQAS